MAPEVIRATGHGRSVDWWMLGVLCFELLAGKAPFEAPRTDLIYELVKKGIEAVVFPHECRGPARDLVRALCKMDPDARLKCPTLRDHAWFRALDWRALRTCRLTPPFVPRVRGPCDLSNFRQCDQEDPPAIHYVDDGSGWDAGFEDDGSGSSGASGQQQGSSNGSNQDGPASGQRGGGQRSAATEGGVSSNKLASSASAGSAAWGRQGAVACGPRGGAAGGG